MRQNVLPRTRSAGDGPGASPGSYGHRSASAAARGDHRASRGAATSRRRAATTVGAAAKLSVAIAAAIAAGGAGDARASEPSATCGAVLATADAELEGAWSVAWRALRAELATLPREECPSAVLRARGGGDHLAIEATSSDGRLATRDVRKPEDLAAIAYGLLAVTPLEAPARAPAVAGADEAIAPPPPDEAKAPLARSRREEAEPRFGATVGVAIGGREAMPTQITMPEVELRVDLRLERSLLVAAVRYAPVGGSPQNLPLDEDAYTETTFGLGLGRRFVAGPSAFDVAIVPTLAAISMESDSFVGGEVGGTGSQLRVDTSLRWGYRVGRRVRFVATADSEITPAALAHASRIRPELPALPAWTMGLRLGAAADLP